MTFRTLVLIPSSLYFKLASRGTDCERNFWLVLRANQDEVLYIKGNSVVTRWQNIWISRNKTKWISSKRDQSIAGTGTRSTFVNQLYLYQWTIHVCKVTNWEQRQNHSKTRNDSLLIDRKLEIIVLFSDGDNC